MNYSIVVVIVVLLFVQLVEFTTGDNNTIFTKESTESRVLSRRRRYLGFTKGTRVFVRLNVKDNVLMINQIWAHAFGFRVNYDIQYPIPKTYKLRRRDVHDNLEELINQHGFDGRACILRNFCEASKSLTPGSGMLFKIFKLIFRNSTDSDYGSTNRLPDGDDKKYPFLTGEDCDELYSHCPFSLLDLSTYTDV